MEQVVPSLSRNVAVLPVGAAFFKGKLALIYSLALLHLLSSVYFNRGG